MYFSMRQHQSSFLWEFSSGYKITCLQSTNLTIRLQPNMNEDITAQRELSGAPGMSGNPPPAHTLSYHISGKTGRCLASSD